MKVGDYVLVKDEGVGKITLVAFHPKYHLVWLLESSQKFAVLRHEERMTLLDPAVADILTAVNN
jgi:uncharacterized protein YbgA (DUF1722 family)